MGSRVNNDHTENRAAWLRIEQAALIRALVDLSAYCRQAATYDILTEVLRRNPIENLPIRAQRRYYP